MCLNCKTLNWIVVYILIPSSHINFLHGRNKRKIKKIYTKQKNTQTLSNMTQLVNFEWSSHNNKRKRICVLHIQVHILINWWWCVHTLICCLHCSFYFLTLSNPFISAVRSYLFLLILCVELVKWKQKKTHLNLIYLLPWIFSFIYYHLHSIWNARFVYHWNIFVSLKMYEL